MHTLAVDGLTRQVRKTDRMPGEIIWEKIPSKIILLFKYIDEIVPKGRNYAGYAINMFKLLAALGAFDRMVARNKKIASRESVKKRV